MKHTKGKWELSENTNQGIRINVGQEDPITMTTICSMSGSPRIAEVTANAKLIAAAPDMLEALIDIKDRIDKCKGLPLTHDEALDSFYVEIINEAIKKATE